MTRNCDWHRAKTQRDHEVGRINLEITTGSAGCWIKCMVEILVSGMDHAARVKLEHCDCPAAAAEMKRVRWE